MHQADTEAPASPTPSLDDAHLTARQVLKAARGYLDAEAAEHDWRARAPRFGLTDGDKRVADARAERTRKAVDQFEHVLGRYVDSRIAAALQVAQRSTP